MEKIIRDKKISRYCPSVFTQHFFPIFRFPFLDWPYIIFQHTGTYPTAHCLFYYRVQRFV